MFFFQHNSAILILSGIHIIQTLLDHRSNFSILSPTLNCHVWLLILSWSSAAISYNVPTMYLSIQYKLAVLLQSAWMSFPFLCHVLLLFLQWISAPFSVYRNPSFLQTLFWKLSSSVTFLIRPHLTDCNLLHVSF